MSTSRAPIVSFANEPLILVDEEDRELGFRSKSECHDGEGLLHRAFSVFLFDSEDRLLLTRRSEEKRLWPGFWSNTCCSHPRRGEKRLEAAHRRTSEELGLDVGALVHLFTFSYHARFGEAGSEHEVCAVFAGRCDEEPRINPREIAEWNWMEAEELDSVLRDPAEPYSPWLRLEWAAIRRDHWHRITGL